jgi:hypothetical protein
MIISKHEKKAYPLAPAGLHRGVLVDTVDLGLRDTNFGGQQRQVRFIFQLEAIDSVSGRPFECARLYHNTLAPKSNLRRDLEAWLARPLSDAETKDGIDLEGLIGTNAQLLVAHATTTDGRTFANIQALVPAAPNMPKLVPSDYVRKTATKATSTTTKAPVSDEDAAAFAGTSATTVKKVAEPLDTPMPGPSVSVAPDEAPLTEPYGPDTIVDIF